MVKKRNDGLMKSAREICDKYGWTMRTFLAFVERGFPARKLGTRWYAVEENVLEWFKKVTTSKCDIDCQ